jgi:uncharacterized protein YraI
VAYAKIPLAAALLPLCVATAFAEPAVVGSKVNLRAGPGAAFAVIATIPSGAKLEVQKCTAKWCRVTFGRDVGYVSRSLIKAGAAVYSSAGPAPATVRTETKPAPMGPRIWKWRDSEWRDRHWRELGWHNRMRR